MGSDEEAFFLNLDQWPAQGKDARKEHRCGTERQRENQRLNRRRQLHNTPKPRSSLLPRGRGTGRQSFQAVARPLHHHVARQGFKLALEVGLVPPLRLFNPNLLNPSFNGRIKLLDQNMSQARFLLRRECACLSFHLIKKCAHTFLLSPTRILCATTLYCPPCRSYATIFAIISLANSPVFAVPTLSRVRTFPSSKPFSIAFPVRSAASRSPRWRSIRMPDCNSAVGLATPCPAMSGAEPCTASNIAPFSPMSAPATRPRPPIKPAHKS